MPGEKSKPTPTAANVSRRKAAAVQKRVTPRRDARGEDAAARRDVCRAAAQTQCGTQARRDAGAMQRKRCQRRRSAVMLAAHKSAQRGRLPPRLRAARVRQDGSRYATSVTRPRTTPSRSLCPAKTRPPRQRQRYADRQK